MPIDSTDNQLALWILFARQINPAADAMIKGDADVEFPVVREVLDILQGQECEQVQPDHEPEVS